jgi:hypothetical protein
MIYRTRIGILIGFIALFLITTPLVVLYTAGYRWNDKKMRPERVGIIFLLSKPNDADIYLNGKLRKESTPARLRDLLPDTYEVTVTKEGFSSWSKKLPVYSALTTFAEGVILWKDAVPEEVGLAPARALTSRELADLTRTDQLSYGAGDTEFRSDGFEIWTSTDRNRHETVTRLSQEIASILPYTDTGWVIYATSDSIHAIERDGRGTRNDYVLATGKDLRGLAVSSDGRTLYYLSGDGDAAKLWRRTLQ